MTPPRRHGHEILDDPAVDPATRLRSIADVARSNLLFGGRRAALRAIAPALVARKRPLTILDVGTGLADIPAAVARRATERSVAITTIAVDEAHELLVAARAARRVHLPIRGTIRALPFRDASIDVVFCSQLLHHFTDDDLGPVIRELNRVARDLVAIADLRRSRLAAAAFWAVSHPLRFDPVTRHDGVVSVMRGFTDDELRRAVESAVGVTPRIQRHLGFRLTASWAPRRTGAIPTPAAGRPSDRRSP